MKSERMGKDVNLKHVAAQRHWAKWRRERKRERKGSEISFFNDCLMSGLVCVLRFTSGKWWWVSLRVPLKIPPRRERERERQLLVLQVFLHSQVSSVKLNGPTCRRSHEVQILNFWPEILGMKNCIKVRRGREKKTDRLTKEEGRRNELRIALLLDDQMCSAS